MLRTLVWSLATMALSVGCSSGDAVKIALVGATVIDGSGRPPIRNAVIIIDGTIVEVVAAADAVSIPKGAQEIDLTGYWIIPGLIDADVRSEAWAMPRFLAYGVTTVRDLRTGTDSILALAEEMRLGTVLGPRVYFAGTPIAGIRDGSRLSAVDVRRAVDRNSIDGSDYITVDATVSPNLLSAIIDESRSFELPVVGYLGLTDAASGAEGGLHSIERLSGIPQAASGNASPFYAAYRQSFYRGWGYEERSWSRLRSGSIDRIAKQLAATHVVITPTLVLHETIANLDDVSQLERAGPGVIPSNIAATWDGPGTLRERGWSTTDLRAFRQGRAVQDRFLNRFRANGGTIAVGTGAVSPFVIPGASLHQEMELLVRAGLDPMVALMAATSGNATVLGADSLGILLAGNVADLVVLSADPLENIRNTRAIENVMIRGHLMVVETIKDQW